MSRVLKQRPLVLRYGTCLEYAKDQALHTETIAREALGTIKLYIETNDKVRVVCL